MANYVVIDEHGFGGGGESGIKTVESTDVIEAARVYGNIPNTVVLVVGKMVGNVAEVVSDPPPNEGGTIRVLVVKQ